MNAQKLTEKSLEAIQSANLVLFNAFCITMYDDVGN